MTEPKQFNSRRPKSLRDQCDKCRHFTGIGNDAEGNRMVDRADVDAPGGRGFCRAGVDYNAVMKRGARMIALPCFKPEPSNMPDDGAWPMCPKQSFKTTAELDAEVTEKESMFAEAIPRITIIRPAILKHAGWSDDPRDNDEIPLGERGVRRGGKIGSFDCPICNKGKLHYTISGYNGHIHARCETSGCVSFME